MADLQAGGQIFWRWTGSFRHATAGYENAEAKDRAQGCLARSWLGESYQPLGNWAQARVVVADAVRRGRASSLRRNPRNPVDSIAKLRVLYARACFHKRESLT